MKTCPTTLAVWRAIMDAHKDVLLLHGSYSAPLGEEHNPSRGVMETAYALPGSDHPFIGARTTWIIDQRATHDRQGEQTEFWFFVAEEL